MRLFQLFGQVDQCFRCYSNFIEGKLGYYALANETSISEGTVEGAYEAVKVVLTATDMLKTKKVYSPYVDPQAIMHLKISMADIVFLTTWLSQQRD